MSRTHAITGAFGYSGRHLAARLLSKGERVVTLTGHPHRPDPFGGRVAVRPFRFDDVGAMAASLADVDVLHNTYWIRFEHGGRTFAQAVENSSRLFEAAARAGVRRIVHTSITNPSVESRLPYFSGKARVEQALKDTGLSHAILRPALFFGGEDVLVNNIAWLLRRLPVFGVVAGSYGLRPIHVDDMAVLSEAQAASSESVTLDAVGPESLAYRELVQMVAAAVGRRPRFVRVSRGMMLLASRLLRPVVGDVSITPDEIEGLSQGLLESSAPSAGRTRFSEWIRREGAALGQSWASELGRHFR